MTEPRKLALYLRSSKDRHEVSISAQRRSLQDHAQRLDATIVAEFTDVVESGKHLNRPGFQSMLHAMKSRDRSWNGLLMLDTSRLGRRRFIGELFRREAAKYGVEVIYKSVPDVDPVSRVILESVLEALDEVHSLISRDKGIAGQVENIRQGFRAGGRAPVGYELEKIPTGATRDGQAVTKTKLRPSNQAPIVAHYLQLRAKGHARGHAMRVAGLSISKTGGVGLDWNALTYAGHTVYGMYAEHYNGERGKQRRKPRKQWLIQENTHEPLITQAEAETIIHAMENSSRSHAVKVGKAALSSYLLTGILYSPDGRQWTGSTGKNGRQYRLKADEKHSGRYLDAKAVDDVAIHQLRQDMTTAEFGLAMINAARQQFDDGQANKERKQAESALLKISKKISRYMELAADLADAGPALREVEKLEEERTQLTDRVKQMKNTEQEQAALSCITPDEVSKLLNERLLAIEKARGPHLKQLIRTLVARITLDPVKLTVQLEYRVSNDDSLCVASPRGCARWTIFGKSKRLKIKY